MAWGQDFLQGFFGAQGLKDYAHAAKTFRTNGYELAPRSKFLYHTRFNLNTSKIPALANAFPELDVANLSLLVKNIQLPQYQIDTETLNQYNRKRIIQKKINYQPVQIEFHDDGGDLSRNLWYNYYSYYFKDPSQAYDQVTVTNGTIGPIVSQPGFDYTIRDIYANNRPVNDWGFIGESYNQGNAGSGGVGSGGDNSSGKPAFFKDITIYGLNQHKWVSYVLINPVISEWRHDSYNYAEGDGTMSNTCIIEYETVKYYTGAVGGLRPDPNVVGFADPAYYDTIPSSLARPGSTASVLGQGGLLDAGLGIIEDLQSGGVTGIIGAVQKAGTTYNTFKDKNLKSIVNEEANTALRSTIRSATLPGGIRAQAAGQGGFSFPRTVIK